MRSVAERYAEALADEQVRAAKLRIEMDLESARLEIEKAAPALAGEIVRVILGDRPGAGTPSEAR